MTEVRVKALMWEDDSDHWHPGTRWRAKDCFGEHYEIEMSEGVFTLSHNALMGDISADALVEAQADAQADYDTRILAALEPQDAPAMAEELVALRAENARLRRETPEALIAAYDKFLCGETREGIGRATALRVGLASSFGVAAYEAALDADQGASAMIRAVLLALIDTAHPELDPLRLNALAAALTPEAKS